MKKLFLMLTVLISIFALSGLSSINAQTEENEEEHNEEETYYSEYAQGYYDYRYADSDLKNTLFAAMEAYLLDTMYGGIPVFSNSGYVLYSNRVDLIPDEFVPVMGWGALRAPMNTDDSGLTIGGRAGIAGEYTYRTALAQDPDTFQQWIYSDATSADILTLILDSLYFYDFNENIDGYEVKPSMAAAMPVAHDTVEMVTDPDNDYAYTWSVAVRDDLKWTFHEDTIAEYPNLEENIVAQDFIDTFKLALDEEWFRATSGGGDFTTAPQAIVNAQAYIDGEVEWDEVGLKLNEDGELEFEFVGIMDEWGVLYWLSSFVMTPIHMGLYDEVGDLYGTSDDTTAYNGAFMMSYYESDREIRLVENPNFHSPNRYDITGVNFQIIEDAAIRFQEYLAGNLDVGAVDPARYDQFAADPDIKFIPGATTFRIMINGLGTVEGQRAEFEGSEWVPEPILANHNFKRAMYFAIDRGTLAYDVLRTSTPQPFLYTEAYLVDPATGVPFRNSPEADLVKDAIGGQALVESYGYSSTLATNRWNDAVAELIADGTYSAGDEITLGLNIFSGSEAQALFGNFIKQSFEDIFQHDDLTVTIDVTPRPFPSIYFDYMMTGDFDLSIGGIAGSTLDAASFMDVFADDNRGGFTLNWGIDTSTANIEVEIPDPVTGEMSVEIWSFNAIQSALVGDVQVLNGEEYKG